MKRTVFFIFVLCFVVFSLDAHAYITPGQGSDITQIILTAVMAVGSFFKNIWFKIFKRNK